MRFRRNDSTPALHRKNNYPTKINIFNELGNVTEGDNAKFCLCCKKLKPIRAFYQHGAGKKPSSFDKKNKLRNMCVECYDEYVEIDGEFRQRKGRFDKPGDNYKPSLSLESFFK